MPSRICDRIFRNLIRGDQICRALVESIREIRPEIGAAACWCGEQKSQGAQIQLALCAPSAGFLMAIGLQGIRSPRGLVRASEQVDGAGR